MTNQLTWTQVAAMLWDADGWRPMSTGRNTPGATTYRDTGFWVWPHCLVTVRRLKVPDSRWPVSDSEDVYEVGIFAWLLFLCLRWRLYSKVGDI